jgi:hypothetical protein
MRGGGGGSVLFIPCCEGIPAGLLERSARFRAIPGSRFMASMIWCGHNAREKEELKMWPHMSLVQIGGRMMALGAMDLGHTSGNGEVGRGEKSAQHPLYSFLFFFIILFSVLSQF